MYWRTVAILALLLGLAASELAAQKAGGIQGRVLERDGAPVSDVSVAVGRGISAVTDAAGRFAIGGLEPGTYTVRIERLGYEPLAREVTVSAGQITRVELRLEPRPIAVQGVTAIGSSDELVELRARLREVPGAVELIESEEIRRTRQANFKDVLRLTPGVYAQPRFGAADETQLSIRGSGLRNNFHLRGVNVLVNGMPYRNADGFTDFESLELLTTENIQVYKGGNALRYGGSTLGGAINFQTATGYSAEPINAFAQGGSWGFAKAQVSSGSVFGDFNYYGSFAHTQLDGYRVHSGQRRERLNAHAGFALSDRIDARAFYFFADVAEDLPGSLTREEFESDERQANSENVVNDWGRDYQLHHIGLQLRTQLGRGQRLEIAPYGQFRDIVHPIFRVLDQDSRDVGVEVRYENTRPLVGRDNRLTLGFQTAFGEVDNRHFENVGGRSGALAKDQRDEAASLAVYAENVIGLTSRLSAVLGFRFDHADRAVSDFFLDDGDQSDDRDYDAALPKLGLLYELPNIGGQLYLNASRSYEPPLLLELNSFTVPGFIELEAQDAWQFEIGGRGRARALGWELSLYDVELQDEIININVQPFPGAPFTVPTYRNSERTRHYGVETGLALQTRGGFLLRGDDLDEAGVRLAYTFARYEFVTDAEFDGNEIPGAPEHVLHGELWYAHPSGLSVRPTLEWVPGDYFVDSQNTVSNDGWFVLGIRSELALQRYDATAFLELRNLTDEIYSPAVNVDDASGRYFQPADGFSVYAGFRVQP